MTNEEKLRAVRAGHPGSYNLAPRDGSISELLAFQPVGAEAHRLAMARGYFCKPEKSVGESGFIFRAVLVTIADHDARRGFDTSLMPDERDAGAPGARF